MVGPLKAFPPHWLNLPAVAAKLVAQRPERRMRIDWLFMMDGYAFRDGLRVLDVGGRRVDW